jgi:hypothetical protein
MSSRCPFGRRPLCSWWSVSMVKAAALNIVTLICKAVWAAPPSANHKQGERLSHNCVQACKVCLNVQLCSPEMYHWAVLIQQQKGKGSNLARRPHLALSFLVELRGSQDHQSHHCSPKTESNIDVQRYRSAGMRSRRTC